MLIRALFVQQHRLEYLKDLLDTRRKVSSHSISLCNEIHINPFATLRRYIQCRGDCFRVCRGTGGRKNVSGDHLTHLGVGFHFELFRFCSWNADAARSSSPTHGYVSCIYVTENGCMATKRIEILQREAITTWNRNRHMPVSRISAMLIWAITIAILLDHTIDVYLFLFGIIVS